MTRICCCFFPLVTVVKQVWPLHFPVTRSFYYSASCNYLKKMIKRTATAVHRSHRERGINHKSSSLHAFLPSVLDCLQNAKTRGERPGLIYHRRDTKADRGRKEPLTKIMILRFFLQCRLKHWSSQCSWSKKVVTKHGLSVRGPLTLPLLCRHWCPHDKSYQAISSHSANDGKTGQWEGLGIRLYA